MNLNPRAKPLFVYDGRCGFCRRWITRWRAMTGDRVEYAPSQEIAQQFPEIPPVEFRKAAVLIDADGQVLTGAEAVFRSLTYAPGHGTGWWMYQNFPGFAPLSRAAYRFIADRRPFFSDLTNLLWGKSTEPPSYLLTRRFFLRMLGVVYLIAFLSLFVQIKGLAGENGISPVAEYLPAVYERYGNEAYWRFPTLAWLSSSDAFLQWGLCGGGAALSILLIVGLFPVPVLILLWAFYLSLTTAGTDFMHFQWDILLLETGLLAIFFAPLSWRLGSPREARPSRIMLLLIRLLLFKLMFLSGLVKLTAGDPSWDHLEALRWHYETQPLPTWTAWYMHHAPDWFHAACTAVTFFIELIVPFLFFGPRRLRNFAAAATVFLMLCIGATGNYNFFNLLTAVLCISLLDDQLLGRFVSARKRAQIRTWPRQHVAWLVLRSAIVVPFAVFVLAVSGVQFYAEVWRREIPQWFATVFEHVRPFRSISNYGLFRVMTKERPEIIIEGSNDGREWKEYELHWKPGDLMKPPRFCQPHQPRLDWEMWFAALGHRAATRVVMQTMQRLLEGSPEVLDLFAVNPFPEGPPKYIRAVRCEYRFTDPATRQATGAWWTRENPRPFIRPRTRPDPQTQLP